MSTGASAVGERHISGRSDVEKWRNQAHSLSSYWVTLLKSWSEDIFGLGYAQLMLPCGHKVNIRLSVGGIFGPETLNLNDPYTQYYHTIWWLSMYICVQYLLIADTADILLWIRVIVNMGAIAATPLPVSLIYQKWFTTITLDNSQPCVLWCHLVTTQQWVTVLFPTCPLIATHVTHKQHHNRLIQCTYLQFNVVIISTNIFSFKVK